MIKGERNVYVSGHVRQAIKDALKAETFSRSVSMSEFIADAIEEKLIREGVLIVEPPQEDEPALPFEEPMAQEP